MPTIRLQFQIGQKNPVHAQADVRSDISINELIQEIRQEFAAELADEISSEDKAYLWYRNGCRPLKGDKSLADLMILSNTEIIFGKNPDLVKSGPMNLGDLRKLPLHTFPVLVKLIASTPVQENKRRPDEYEIKEVPVAIGRRSQDGTGLARIDLQAESYQQIYDGIARLHCVILRHDQSGIFFVVVPKSDEKADKVSKHPKASLNDSLLEQDIAYPIQHGDVIKLLPKESNHDDGISLRFYQQ
jgi:hypothetical protein